MPTPVDLFTHEALGVFGNEGSKEHFRLLRETGRPHATRCPSCGHAAFPPRPFCPACFGERVDWVPFPDDLRLHAFTTQTRGLRFAQPAVIGLVEVPGVGLVLGPVDAPYDALRIGQTVRVALHRIDENLLVHRFVPAEPGDRP